MNALYLFTMMTTTTDLAALVGKTDLEIKLAIGYTRASEVASGLWERCNAAQCDAVAAGDLDAAGKLMTLGAQLHGIVWEGRE